MNLNVYDKELNRVLIIGERYISCLWSEGYNTAENFTLELNLTDEYRDKIKVDRFVGRQDRATLMVIKTVEIAENKIVVGGTQATRILDDVAFVGTIRSGSDIESAVLDAYDKSSQYYKLDFAENSLGIIYEHDISNKSFKELCETMADNADAGLRLVKVGDGMKFSFYKPSIKNNLIFSEKYGNITIDSVSISNEDYKNYAIVLGAGEGDNRVKVIVDEANGGEKRELLIDARDLSQEDGETVEEYEARLAVRGHEELMEQQQIYTCSFTPYANDFGIKYDLGDILTIYASSYGFNLTARVSKFTQKSQNNKTETSVEVGNIVMKRRLK